MKTGSIVAVLVVGGALIWMLGVLGGSSIGPDTRVEVLTTEPVRVLLPVDATASSIETRLRAALRDSVELHRDPRMADFVASLAGDNEIADHIAGTSFEQFDSGVAAGIAFGIYDAAIGEQVVLYSVTVELVPSFYGVGNTVSHEDGHWIVNTGVAQRCGPRIVRQAASGSIFPSSLRNTIVSRLQDADEAVHSAYHSLARGAFAGGHRVAALQALDDVIGPACERLE